MAALVAREVPCLFRSRHWYGEGLDFEPPYGQELELFQDYEGRIFDEPYVDFDFRATPADSSWILSYGEYVEVPPDNRTPFVDRAERRASFYADAFETSIPPTSRTLRAKESHLLEHIGNVGPDNMVD